MRQIAPIVIAVAAIALVACRPGARSAADSVPPIDTLKPAVAGDTLPTTPKDSVVTKAPATPSTKTKTGSSKGELRDSAFPPPRNLPRLDTVPTKRRPPKSL